MRGQAYRLARAVPAAAIVLASVVVAGACGRDENEAAKTVTEVETRTVTQAVTETVVANAERGDRNQAPARARRVLRFSGKGDAVLPPIRVREGGAVLRWRNDGDVLTLFGRKQILVDSTEREGTRFLRPGRHRIEVVASGRWEIRIPNSRRLR